MVKLAMKLLQGHQLALNDDELEQAASTDECSANDRVNDDHEE